MCPGIFVDVSNFVLGHVKDYSWTRFRYHLDTSTKNDRRVDGDIPIGSRTFPDTFINTVRHSGFMRKNLTNKI